MVPMLANSDPNVPACTRARNHTCSRHVHQHAKLAHDTRSARRKTGTASFLISIFSSSVPGSSSDALVAMVELASSAAANKTANAASCSLGIPLGEGEKWRRVHLVRKQKKCRVEPLKVHTNNPSLRLRPQRMRPSLFFSVSVLSLCFFLHLLVALRLRSLRFHSPRLCRVAVSLIQTNVSLPTIETILPTIWRCGWSAGLANSTAQIRGGPRFRSVRRPAALPNLKFPTHTENAPPQGVFRALWRVYYNGRLHGDFLWAVLGGFA